MDAIVLHPVAHSTLIKITIADGSEGMSHSEGVFAADLKARSGSSARSSTRRPRLRPRVEEMRRIYAGRNASEVEPSALKLVARR